METHGCAGADLSGLCTEAAFKHIREKVSQFDIEEDTIDVGILDSLAVTRANFMVGVTTTSWLE